MGRSRFDDLRPASELEMQEFWDAHRGFICELLEEAKRVSFGGNGDIMENLYRIATLPEHPQFRTPNFIWTTGGGQLAICLDGFAKAFNIYAARPRVTGKAQHHRVAKNEEELVDCVRGWVRELLR